MNTDPAETSEPDAGQSRQGLRKLLLMLGGASMLYAIVAGILYGTNPHSISFAARMALILVGPYLGLAPVAYHLALRYPLTSWRRVPAHLGLLLAFALGSELLAVGATPFVLPPPPFHGHPHPPPHDPPFSPMEWDAPPPTPGIVPYLKLQTSVPVYALILGLAHIARSQSILRGRERRTRQLEADLARAQLAALQSRIRPHFLFNTLNSIAALVPTQPREANLMLTNLADLLHSTLDLHPLQEVTLAEELDLVDRYIEIQKLRFADRVTYLPLVPDDLLTFRVPPFILQPLVENAFEHGFSDPSDNVRITLEARRSDLHLHLELTDNGEGPSQPRPPREGSGVGLSSTRQRLQTLYGDAQRLEASRLRPRGFRVSLQLPLRASSTEPLAPLKQAP